MTHGSQPHQGWWAPEPAGGPAVPRMPQLGVLVLVGVVALLLAAGAGLVAGQNAGHRHAVRVGDCVVLTSSSEGQLHAAKAGCDTDPSFTVAKMTETTNSCVPSGYDRFSPPSADDGTGRLCLVPNLVVGHCYRLGVAVGIWNLVNCAGAGPATIKVTNRFDSDDGRACAPGDQLPARTYPAPPRTYCLGLAG